MYPASSICSCRQQPAGDQSIYLLCPADLPVDVRAELERFGARHTTYRRGLPPDVSALEIAREFRDHLLRAGVLTAGAEGHADGWAIESITLGEDRPLPFLLPDRPDLAHPVFRLGAVHIDWTARQFDARAPFPLMWTTAPATPTTDRIA